MQPQLKLDDEFVKYVRPAITEVWNYVGHDVEQACAEQGERLTNEGAVECCLDAGRLCTDVRDKKHGAEVQEFLRKAYDKFGYMKVFKFLCKHIRYA